MDINNQQSLMFSNNMTILPSILQMVEDDPVSQNQDDLIQSDPIDAEEMELMADDDNLKCIGEDLCQYKPPQKHGAIDEEYKYGRVEYFAEKISNDSSPK